jgi:hypothetical protein
LNSLSDVQLHQQSQLVKKLLAIDVSNNYRGEQSYQQLINYRKTIQLLNEQSIITTLSSNSAILDATDTLNNIQLKEKSELIHRLLTKDVSDDFSKSESFKQLVMYQR